METIRGSCKRCGKENSSRNVFCALMDVTMEKKKLFADNQESKFSKVDFSANDFFKAHSMATSLILCLIVHQIFYKSNNALRKGKHPEALLPCQESCKNLAATKPFQYATLLCVKNVNVVSYDLKLILNFFFLKEGRENESLQSSQQLFLRECRQEGKG